MDNTLILAVLAVVVLGIVARPLWQRGRGAGRAPVPRRGATVRATDVPDDSPAALALREIELDHEMGRLSDDDYRAMRERYERELDAARGPTIPLARVAGRDAAPAAGDLDARAEALIAQFRGRGAACPSCGVRPEPDATFCSSCGRRLAPCPSCGRTISEPEAQFCPSCGASLTA